jgi:outer membrane protein OmpA-like peptidoglycan-associated protein
MPPGGTADEADQVNGVGAPADEETASATQEGAVGTPARTALSLKSGAAPLTAALSGNSALPQSFALNDVKFPTASAKLPKNAMLNDVASALKQHESAHVRLEGYADARGSQQVNERLSEQRAQSVKNYLVARGVAADQIETVGRATDEPRATNASQQGRADNRRVELVLTER